MKRDEAANNFMDVVTNFAKDLLAPENANLRTLFIGSALLATTLLVKPAKEDVPLTPTKTSNTVAVSKATP